MPINKISYTPDPSIQRMPPPKNKGVDLKIKQVAYVILKTLRAALVLAAASLATLVSLPVVIFSTLHGLYKKTPFIIAIADSIFMVAKPLEWAAPHLPRPLAYLANAIHAGMTEILSTVVMSALYFKDLEKCNPQSMDSGNHQPILLVHGLYHNSSAWAYHRQLLLAAGLGPIFTVNLDRPFVSIKLHAEKLREKIIEIQKITGDRALKVVGHSMGGLDLSELLLNTAKDEFNITDVVTIGSPLKGTHMTFLGIGKSVKEMRYEGDYIKDLAKRICEQDRIQYFHISTEMDELVIPSSSASLIENKNAKRLVLPNLGHNGLLYSKRVNEALVEHLKSGGGTSTHV